MHINKNRFTVVALGLVEPNREYDRDDVILETAQQMANEFHEELGWGAMSLSAHQDLVEVFREVGRDCIDWPRLNKKVFPDEYADDAWRMADDIAQMRANL